MNFDPGKPARHLGNESRQETHVMAPQPTAQVMKPHGVQTRIQNKNFEVGTSSGVGLEDGGDVFPNRPKEGGHWAVLSSQFSVLSSQFSVLSSQFSVLSSQFSVSDADREMRIHSFRLEPRSDVTASAQSLPPECFGEEHLWASHTVI